MAEDKLVDSTQLDSDLTSVADAIRAKGGTSADLAFPAGFVSAVEAIETGGGGGYTAADFADPSKPVGPLVFTQTTMPDATYFAHRTGITSIFGVNYNETANRTNTFRECTGLQYAVFPKLKRMYNTFLYGCTNLLAIDWLGGATGSSLVWSNCSKLKTMVIREADGICALSASNAFNNTPFASGGTGGTLYVPQARITEYTQATNWSTILGYANNQILPIEGSIYETQYVDGTPIT